MPIDTQMNLLNFEREKVQHLQPSAVLPIAPLNPAHALGFESTLAPAEATEGFTPRFKPQLEHPALASLRVFGKAEASAGRQAKLFDTQVTSDLATIDRLNNEKEIAIKDFLEKEKSKKTWGMLATVIQYLASTASAFVAIACLATGNIVPALFLLTSVAVNMTTALSRDFGLYEKVAAWFTKSIETQKKIVNVIEMGAFFLSLSTAMAGGYMAYAGALNNLTDTLVGQAGRIFQTGTALMGSGARLKNNHLQLQIAKIQKEMKMMELEIDSHYQNIDLTTSDGQKMSKKLADMAKEIKRTIQLCGRAAEAA